MTPPDPKTLLLGLLNWTSAEGVRASRVRVMKFLYLADVHYARHHEGCTLTGWRWHVNSWGPMANEAYDLFSRGAAEGWLAVTQLPGREEGISTFIYGANETVPGDALVAVGQVRRWIKQFGDDSARLLREVYGNTEPMDGALHGDDLDFSRCRPLEPALLVHKKPGKAQKAKFAALTKILMAKEAPTLPAPPDGPLDDAYFEGLPQDESLSGDLMLDFKVRH